MKRYISALALAFAFCASPAHSQYTVRIFWTASSDAAANPSLTYNVYRAAACAEHFAKLNSAPVTGTSYVDTNVGAGAAYCYQVTAVLSGVESVPSNQAVAAVPPPSDRQATCEHHGAIIGWIRCVAARPKRTNPQSPPR
jgi:fibronectin type 3 domain-containing protein